MNRRIVRLTGLLAAGAMALAVVGPVSAATPQKLTAVVATDNTGAPAAGQAGIRVLHASPDAPAVDVYLDGAATPAITNLAFGEMAPALATGGYIALPAGDHAVKVCATGSTTVCPIDVPVLTLVEGKKYTIAATNVLAKISPPQVIEDTATQAETTAQVRVYHFSADTPAVDILTTSGTKLAGPLAYPEASGYLTPAAGTLEVKVCAAPADTLCPLGPLSLTVADGTTYSVFAIGSLAATLPAATAPATDVVSTTDTAPASSNPAILLIVAAAGLAFVGGLRLATSRARR